ncbi:hypothetical protein BKA83DRAFT_4130571 [Pisolithus microcarpus]|nr:hypothetical protein BKA83DRAFT_4130571 [Pisolithus microcarpus]
MPVTKDFEFRLWGDPLLMLLSPISNIPLLLEGTGEAKDLNAEYKDGILSFKPLPKQSAHVTLILDRFWMHCPVQYCSNNLLVKTMVVMGQSFYNFVSPKNEQWVHEWIDLVKAWGINERGQPSDGGFGFSRFTLLHKGRDSRGKQKKTTPSHGSRHKELFVSLKGQLSKTLLLGSSSSKTYTATATTVNYSMITASQYDSSTVAQSPSITQFHTVPHSLPDSQWHIATELQR